jgi:polysaccharide biosynthesis transport protein
MKDIKSLEPSDYLRIPWRRRWYVLTGFFLVLGGALIYSWSMPDIYRSVARIQIENTSMPYVRSVSRSSPQEQIKAIRQHVESRSFLERVIQEFQLFGYGSDTSFSSDVAAAKLSNRIEVRNVSRDTFSIAFMSGTPQTAQTINRRIIETLIQAGNAARKANALETDQFIEDQLRQTEQKLKVQEDKITQFKRAHLGALPEQGAANINTLNGLHSQLTAVENALQQARDQQKLIGFRAQDQSRLNALTSSILTSASSASLSETGRNKPSSEINPALKAKEEKLAALTLKYTSKHPDVILLAREVEDLKRQDALKNEFNGDGQEMTALGNSEKDPRSGSLGNEASAAGAMWESESMQLKMEAETIKNQISKREKERDSILHEIKLCQSRLNLAPALEQEFESLSRERDALSRQYSNLWNKKFQTEMTTDLETDRYVDTYKVIDPPSLPEKAAFPDRMQIILIGVGAGFIVGIGAAFGRELLNTTLSSEDEVTAVLKLPVLATISEVTKKQPQKMIGSFGMRKSA